MTSIKIKRVYEVPEKKDGFRILVDRLWPRALKKENAHADEWMKKIAPSVELRKWFNHDPEKWTAFKKAYRKELSQLEAVGDITAYCRKHKVITLLYAAKDKQHNHAIVLQGFLNKRLK